MNFNMFSNLQVTQFGKQFLVQGRRWFMTKNYHPVSYKPETFLITTDEDRAWAKFTALQNCTAKIGMHSGKVD